MKDLDTEGVGNSQIKIFYATKIITLLVLMQQLNQIHNKTK